MSFDIRDHSIPAGQRVPLMVPGRFLTIISATESLNVYFVRANTRYGKISGLDAPFSVGPVVPAFEGVEIETASGLADTVKLGITDDPVQYLRTAGAVTVTSGSIAISNTPTIQAITDPVEVRSTLGATPYFRESSSSALNTILAPASNTNGVLITAVWAWAWGTSLRIMAKASAPTAWNDPAAIPLVTVSAASSTAPAESGGSIAVPIIVPAGLGLYEQAAGIYWGAVSMAYEVL